METWTLRWPNSIRIFNARIERILIHYPTGVELLGDDISNNPDQGDVPFERFTSQFFETVMDRVVYKVLSFKLLLGKCVFGPLPKPYRFNWIMTIALATNVLPSAHGTPLNIAIRLVYVTSFNSTVRAAIPNFNVSIFPNDELFFQQSHCRQKHLLSPSLEVLFRIVCVAMRFDGFVEEADWTDSFSECKRYPLLGNDYWLAISGTFFDSGFDNVSNDCCIATLVRVGQAR